MDFRRFSTIAHSEHDFASPVSGDRAMRLLRLAGVHKGAHVLDVGCGFGSWSTLALEEGASVIGVDPNAAFIERGRERSPGVTWVTANYEPDLILPQTQDVVLCIGSTHALGGIEQVLVESRRVLRANGAVLVGEGFWKQTPDPAYLAILGAEPGEMVSHSENARRIVKAGWRVTYSTTATEPEWDDYEGRYRSSMVHWLRENPSDPEAEAFRKRSDDWYEAYLNWGRHTLGFGYYVATPS